MTDDTIKLVAAVFQLGDLIARLDYVGAAKRAVELGLDLVPVEELRGYLDAEQARRDRAMAEAALAAKFPREP